MIPFCKAQIGKKERKAVDKVLKSGWLTTGKVTRQFEKEFAEYVDSEYAVAVSSCTVALELALKCKGIGKGDLVIVPSFTFAATAQAPLNVGADILFGDIEPVNYTLDPRCPHVKLGLKHAKAVIPVHLGGRKARTDYLNKIVIEDSAHRIERGQCAGNNNLVCFSFYPTKNMTTGEGGMIATNSREDYEWLLKARSHGRDKLVGHGYEVHFTGMKANLPDVLSAIGLEQLKKLDWMNRKRDEIVELYNMNLNRGKWHGNHLYPIFVKDAEDFIRYMRDNGVQCSQHFQPLHKMKGFAKHNKFKLLMTEKLAPKEVSLPLYPALKRREVLKICKLINDYEN